MGSEMCIRDSIWDVQQYYICNSSSTYSNRPTDPPTQGPTIYSSLAGTYSNSMCVNSLMQTLYCCIVLVFAFLFPCFHDPPPYRGPGTAPFVSRRSLLAEAGVDACSFAGDPEDCCVGQAWHGRAANGGRLAHERAVPKRGIPKQA